MAKKIMISEGCTAFYTTVDGKLIYGEYNAMTDEERSDFVDYLCDKLRIEAGRGTVSINQLIELFQYVKYDTEDHCCDQCGDTVSRTYWEI